MATNQQAISDLEKAKTALEAQVTAGAVGQDLTNLMEAIGSIATEVGQLVQQALAAVYIPQTDPFKAATGEAQAFVAQLNAIKAAFDKVAQVASAVASVLKYVG